MKKIVITGPTGTIGIALIKLLIANNVEVLAIVRENSKNRINIPSSDLVKIVECNLDHLKHLNINGKYDTFIHFAWDGTVGKNRDDLVSQLSNVAYTLDAVNLAHKLGCNLFIGAGSQAEYGRSNQILTPDSLTNPESGYGIAKLTAGHMSRNLCNRLNINHIWVRVFSIYGPYDDEHTLIMSLLRNIKNNTEMNLTAGEQIWDYLYSEDAANAFYLLSKSNLTNKTYCLGSGVGKPLKEYINQIQVIVNPDYQLNYGATPYSQNQVMHLIADITQLSKDTGFVPTTSFESGIKSLIKEDTHETC